jgi:hypothetical protein
MFGKQNKTKEDKKESKKLLKERKEKYQNN